MPEQIQKASDLILGELSRGGKMSITDIARQTNFHRNSVAKYVDILEAAGLVSKTIVGPTKLYSVTNTNRHAAETSLQHIEQAFSLSNKFACVSTLQGEFVYICDAFERVLGYNKDYILSTPFINFVHHHDVEQTTKVMGVLNEGRPVKGFENRWRSASGAYIHVKWNAKVHEGVIIAIGTIINTKDIKVVSFIVDADGNIDHTGSNFTVLLCAGSPIRKDLSISDVFDQNSMESILRYLENMHPNNPFVSMNGRLLGMDGTPYNARIDITKCGDKLSFHCIVGA